MNKEVSKNLIASLATLISFESVKSPALDSMPFGKGISDALGYVLSIASDIGMSTHNMDGYCGYADIGDGIPFAILTHLDVVPAGESWNTDPFTLTEKGKKLFGRGILDNKAPTLAVLLAVKELLQNGLKPKRAIRFIFGCDEESGWSCIDHYLKYEKMPDEGFSPDADFPLVNVEKGIMHTMLTLPLPQGLLAISGGQRANMVADFATCSIAATQILDGEHEIDVQIEDKGDFLQLTSMGKSAHGSTPELGDNAIVHLLGALSTLCGGVFSKLYEMLTFTDGSGLQIATSDNKSGSLSVCVGKISMDSALHITLDIRYPISANEELLLDKLRSNFNDMSFEVIGGHKPLYVDESSPLIKALLEAYREVTNDMTLPLAIGGGTYARALKMGVAFGPSFPNGECVAHKANEYMLISDIEKMYDIYYYAIKKLCF